MRLYYVLYTRNHPKKILGNNEIHYLQSFFQPIDVWGGFL